MVVLLLPMFAELLSGAQAMETNLQSGSVTLVDLAVRELAVSPEQPDAGATVQIRTLVLNLSNVSAPVTTVFVVDEHLIKAVNTTVSGLGFQFIDATWKAIIGNHSLRVEVSPTTTDYQDVLPENNVLRRNLNVAVPSYFFTVAIVATGGNHSVQTRLFVDDVFWGRFRGGESIPVVFERSTLWHKITVDAELEPAFGVVYVTKDTAISVNDTGTHTFNYEAQYLLQVTTIPSELELLVGSTWYPAGTTVPLPDLPPNIEKPEEPGTRWVLRSWSLDGRLYEQRVVFMDGPHFAQALYDTLYHLTVRWQNNDSRCAIAPAEGWYPADSTVNVVSSPSSCWWPDGLGWFLGLQANASPSSSSVIMKGPTTVQIAWTDPSGADILAGIAKMLTLVSGWLAAVITNLKKLREVWHRHLKPKLSQILRRSRGSASA